MSNCKGNQFTMCDNNRKSHQVHFLSGKNKNLARWSWSVEVWKNIGFSFLQLRYKGVSNKVDNECIYLFI